MTCVGDTLAFCENFYHTVVGDTCDSVTSTLGTILRVGLGGGACTSLPADTPVCVRPGANKVRSQRRCLSAVVV